MLVKFNKKSLRNKNKLKNKMKINKHHKTDIIIINAKNWAKNNKNKLVKQYKILDNERDKQQMNLLILMILNSLLTKIKNTKTIKINKKIKN